MGVSMIIDLHAHCNNGSKFDCPETEIDKRSFEFLNKKHSLLNIEAIGISYYSSVLQTENIYQDNASLAEQCKVDKKIFQWLVLDPRQEFLFEQIKSMINCSKVLGIKIHSVCHGYDIEEYADKIFSFANELKCFVLMHPDKISNMVKYVDKYPNMKLIIAHLGSIEHVNAIRRSKHGNIFTDTSGGASNLNNVIEYAVEQVGSEKIFFGTDNYDSGFQYGRIQYALISEKDKENIFYNNAKKYFAKQFKNF